MKKWPVGQTHVSGVNMKRKETREEAVKIAYSMDVNKEFNRNNLTEYLEHFELEDADVDYLNKSPHLNVFPSEFIKFDRN